MRFKALLEADPELRVGVGVPAVIPSLSREAVITTELVPGVHIDKVGWLLVLTTTALTVMLTTTALTIIMMGFQCFIC